MIAMILLTNCAGAGSDAPPGACPPVVEYSRAEQARVAEEFAALPDDRSRHQVDWIEGELVWL